MSFEKLIVTLSTSMISCWGELVSITSSFSCFSTQPFGSVDPPVGAALGISLISLFIQSNCTYAAVFFTRNYIWRWIFQFLIATKDPQLCCPLLVWMNIKCITVISLLQWKLLRQFFLMMETNDLDMVYLNFTLQCQHFDIFLCYQWNILLNGMLFFFWLQGLISV